MSDTESLFEKGDPFDLEEPPAGGKRKRRRNGSHIGCELSWLRRVLPLVHSKEQLAVALWLQRRQAVCGGSDWFTVPNTALRDDLDLTRFAKYRALRNLEKAGVVTTISNGRQSLLVKLLW